MPLVEVKDLVVRYGRKVAVEGLDLSFEPGEVVGLLGLNGAGKSTTIKAILGMIRAQQGFIQILNSKPGSIAAIKRIGFAPEEVGLPDFLTQGEYMKFVAGLKFSQGLPKKKEAVEELCQFFELDLAKPIKDCSKGMKRRLLLAQAFMGQPALIILDEPLNGLDPLIILKLRDRIRKYRESGGSVLYSSHILSEVQETCTHLNILSHGKRVFSDSVPNAISQFGTVEKAFSHFVAG